MGGQPLPTLAMEIIHGFNAEQGARVGVAGALELRRQHGAATAAMQRSLHSAALPYHYQQHARCAGAAKPGDAHRGRRADHSRQPAPQASEERRTRRSGRRRPTFPIGQPGTEGIARMPYGGALRRTARKRVELFSCGQ